MIAPNPQIYVTENNLWRQSIQIEMIVDQVLQFFTAVVRGLAPLPPNESINFSHFISP